MGFKNHLAEFDFKPPDYFTPNIALNKKIEFYIHSMKAKAQINSMTNNMTSKNQETEITTVKTLGDIGRIKKKGLVLQDFDEPPLGLSTGNKSINELSKNILSITTPSFNNPAEHSQKVVFRAPKRLQDRAGAGEENKHRHSTDIQGHRWSFSQAEEDDNPQVSTNDGDGVAAIGYSQKRTSGLLNTLGSQKPQKGRLSFSLKKGDQDNYKTVQKSDRSRSTTPDHSFVDSFITPHPRQTKVLDV